MIKIGKNYWDLEKCRKSFKKEFASEIYWPLKDEEYNDYTAWRLSAAAGIAKSKARKEARAKRLDNKKPKKEKSKTINKGRDDTYFFYPH